MKSRIGVVALLPLLPFAVACSPYRPTAGDPATASLVRVSFSPPRALAARGPQGEVLQYQAVRELRGTVTAVGPDTIHVRVGRMRFAGGMSSGVLEGSVVAIPRDAKASMGVASANDARTAAGLSTIGAVLGLVAVVLLVAGLISISSLDS